jgi:cyclic beta-1,2-glucan synthetase
MYRLGIEAILGVYRIGDTLKINPCIPKIWPGFKITYRFGATHYLINVENPDQLNQGVEQVLVDGKLLTDNVIPLVDDGRWHEVNVLMGLATTLDVSPSLEADSDADD